MTCMTAIIIIMMLGILEGYLIAVFRECYRREMLRQRGAPAGSGEPPLPNTRCYYQQIYSYTSRSRRPRRAGSPRWHTRAVTISKFIVLPRVRAVHDGQRDAAPKVKVSICAAVS